MTAIVDQFARIVRDSADRPLIHIPARERPFTAADIWTAHLGYRQQLHAAGLGTGDLLLSALGSRPSGIPLLLACWSLGVTVMPADASTPPGELTEIAERFHASAVASQIAVANDAAAALTLARRDDAPAALDGAVLLKLTSGSTGLPKAVLTRASHILADTEHIVAAMEIGPDDVQLAIVPLSHAFGFGNLVMPMLLQGTPMVLRDGFVPQLLPADARRFLARVCHGVPFMFQYFISNPPGDGWPPTLTRLISAGARLAPETVHGFHERFGVKVRSFYGASETGGIAFDHSDAIDDVGTVGWPLPGVTVSMREGEGVPTGHGRIHVRSAAVAAGYLDDAAGNADFTDGGFLTGDYGDRHADGRLVLAGRVSVFINVAGRKVQPAEVERVLRSLDGIDDARVIGVSDPSRGEQIVAVVAACAPLTAAEIRRRCGRHLAAYKIPRVVIFVDRIPLTPRGKTDHRALQALAADHLRPAPGITVL